MFSFMEPYLFDKELWGKLDLYKQEQDYDGYGLRPAALLSRWKKFQ